MHPVATTGSRGFWMRAITASRAEHFPIGELSRLTGVNIETIRYYERIKMLPAPPRTPSGRRVYGPATFASSHSYDAHANSGFRSMKSAHCCAWERPERRLAERSRTSPLIICKMSGQRFPTLQKLERLLAKTIARCSGNDGPGLPRAGYSRYQTLQVGDANVRSVWRSVVTAASLLLRRRTS